MSRKLRTVIILGALFVVLAVLYFAVIAPWYKAKTEDPEEEPPELLDGEVLGTNNRILLFEHVEKADMLSIEASFTAKPMLPPTVSENRKLSCGTKASARLTEAREHFIRSFPSMNTVPSLKL